MELKMALTGLAVVLFAGCGSLCGQDNCVRNGDFEQIREKQAIAWKSAGAVEPKQVSGVWQKMTGKFNSGARTEADFLFFMYNGSLGSVWIDNVTFSPAAPMPNASFEGLGPDGMPANCSISYWNEAVFSDSIRSSDGKRSLRMTHKDEAVPESQMRQKVSLKPNQEYTYSFDVFLGDDFQGEAMACVENLSNYLAVSTLAASRDRCGRYALALSPSEASPAEIAQEVTVKPVMNLRAGVDVNNKAFNGAATLSVEDPASGRVLATSTVKDSGVKWQNMQVSFESASPHLRIRVVAEGTGPLLVDNVEVVPPEVVPPLQQVQWLPATENFSVPAQLEVFIQGQAGKAIDGGLELLAKDLKKHNVTLARTDSAAAPLKLSIASANEVRGRGPESYSLTVNKDGVTIKSGAESGAFYGLMTLLQLLENRNGRLLALACEATDYPDMPMRGILYGDAEQAARWKMNTFMHSAGYPVSAEQRKALSESIRKCERLNQQYIPYGLAMMAGVYVERTDPNLAAGIWVRDEKITLKGTEPSPLANPYVIRTRLTDVKLKSLDGAKEYTIDKDYQVINGDMEWNYGWNGEPIPGYTPTPFTVARLPGSSIADGSTVLASYDWVSHYRVSDNRTETHIAYVPLEPETRRLMDEFLTGLVREFPLSYTAYANCLHEFGPNDAQLATDSRVILSGKKPIQLFAEDISAQAAAVKKGNPKTKALFWAGDMKNPYVRAAEPLISRDAHAQIWGYDANWPAVFGRDAVEFWSRLGFETSVMAWDNLRNVQGWAQVVAGARRKGYPCLGIIDACWADRTGGFRETAIVSWKIPKEGEKGFVVLPKPVGAGTQDK